MEGRDKHQGHLTLSASPMAWVWALGLAGSGCWDFGKVKWGTDLQVRMVVHWDSYGDPKVEQQNVLWVRTGLHGHSCGEPRAAIAAGTQGQDLGALTELRCVGRSSYGSAQLRPISLCLALVCASALRSLPLMSPEFPPNRNP